MVIAPASSLPLWLLFMSVSRTAWVSGNSHGSPCDWYNPHRRSKPSGTKGVSECLNQIVHGTPWQGVVRSAILETQEATGQTEPWLTGPSESAAARLH